MKWLSVSEWCDISNAVEENWGSVHWLFSTIEALTMGTEENVGLVREFAKYAEICTYLYTGCSTVHWLLPQKELIINCVSVVYKTCYKISHF